MSSEIELPIVLSPGAVMPRYATSGAAGLDVCCLEAVNLQPMERALIGTGLNLAIPEGFEAQVRPRSGLALKYGLSLVNSPGTIDSDYRGELKILMINLGADVVKLESGQRIAQLVVSPVTRVQPRAVERLPSTERGAGGFGSTGTK